ncbi:ribonuclease Oy-like protein [Leptotrombidium deliense]|uniref:Ribonuclease Oy-like protein n=1 Tax=Leptotrombidium deliense TaxID=299467 RepID=A0A443S0I1_9ACAR|nr:ribonuclease Oy-like protein [Leptotrombidium deliense]
MLTTNVLCLILFSVVAVNALKCSEYKSKKPTVKEVVLAVEWAPGVCVKNKECGNFKPQWSIHGLWPQNGERCCEESYNRNLVRAYYRELEGIWPTLKTGFANERFWAHEWTKHGTCAYAVDSLTGQARYFSNGMRLFRNLQMPSILSASKINPTNKAATAEYKILAIKSAIRNKIKVNVQLICREVPTISKIPILQEIRVCYDKGLKYIDCSTKDVCKGDSVLFVSK